MNALHGPRVARSVYRWQGRAPKVCLIFGGGSVAAGRSFRVQFFALALPESMRLASGGASCFVPALGSQWHCTCSQLHYTCGTIAHAAVAYAAAHVVGCEAVLLASKTTGL